MAKDLGDFVLDPAKCRQELTDLQTLLSASAELSERNEIQPLFKQSPHLSSFIGACVPQIGVPDRLGFEVSLLGDFTADLVVGSQKENAYCLIEFEDARTESIFRKSSRSTPEWGFRFEHGFSQIVDWFCQLEDFRRTDRFRRLFGSGPVTFYAMLLIGRSNTLSDDDVRRLRWRTDKVLIDSNTVLCLTYDQLHRQLSDRLVWYDLASRSDD